MNDILINKAQRLYVIKAGGGYTCLGFDVCHEQGRRYAEWLGLEWKHRKGSLAAWNARKAIIALIFKSGRKCEVDLTPQLLGLEGRRVEVIDKFGELRRFRVGRSTGIIPIHLELASTRSAGGSPVYGAPFKSIKIIN